MDRSEKVAAARRKLKKFQQKSKSGTPTSTGSGDSSPQVVRQDKSEQAAKVQKNDVAHSKAKAPRVSTSKEKLKEMSTEINDMLAKSPYVVSNSAAMPPASPDRNQTKRLARALQTQTGLVEDLNQQLQKQASQVSSLHQENVRLRNELQRYHEHESSADHRQKELELNGLKEQLKVHIQTIDILVEEKSALQSSCHKQQTLALEKTRECEELMQRLQACHKRVKDMEVMTDDLTSQQKHHQQEALLHQKQLASLQDAVHQLTNECDELKQEVQELKQRLESQMTQCQHLEEANDQMKSKLSMSETLVQQLSSGGHGVDDLEKALRESRDENQRVADQMGQVTRLLQTVAAERDHLSHQNTEVVEQYEGRVQQLTAQITALANERGALVAHLQQQTALVKELENKNVSENISEKLQAALEQAASEKASLALELEARTKENEQLQRLADEQTTEIVQLQSTVKRLSEEAVDRTEMLSSMHNDKETISRLLLQNKELKAQLEELQTGFVRVTNDKMQLASDLQSYEHHNKQLKAQLDEQRVDEDTNSENVGLREKIQHLQEENLHLADRLSQHVSFEMSHNAAPDPNEMAQLVEKLKQELSASQHIIQQLSAENAGLQNTLLTLHNQTLNESSALSDASDASSSNSLEPQGNHPVESSGTRSVPAVSQVDAVAALSARTHQLQVERHQLAQQLFQQKEVYEQHLRALQESGSAGLGSRVIGDVAEQSVTGHSLDDTVSRNEFDQLEVNFNQLQDRFVKVMREKAELNDEIQRLEHLVMQLELETDTIGEYISLYHHQRDQLKAKFEHKDREIAALTADKTRIQGQVRELQRLMSGLVNERQALHERLTDQGGLANQLTLSQTQNGSEDSESSSEDEEHSLTEESGHVMTSSTPVDSRERQIFELLQKLGRSSRSSGNVYTYDPPVGRVSFFPFTGSCGKEVLVL